MNNIIKRNFLFKNSFVVFLSLKRGLCVMVSFIFLLFVFLILFGVLSKNLKRGLVYCIVINIRKIVYDILLVLLFLVLRLRLIVLFRI